MLRLSIIIGGGAEFESYINHINGGCWVLPLPPRSPPIAPARSKLPLSTHTRPSPLQRDVGRFYLARPGDMDGGIQGGTQEMGGPAGASRKRATTFVVARFRHSFFPLPPLTTLGQPDADVRHHTMTRGSEC